MSHGSWDARGRHIAAERRSTITSEGLKETFLSAGGLPAGWRLHVARARRGAAALGLPWPGEARLAAAVLGALAGHRQRRVAADEQRLRVRLLLLATGSTAAHERPDGVDLRVAVHDVTVSDLDLKPRHLALGPNLRAPGRPLAGCKTIAMADDLVALRSARAAGFDDVLIRDCLGRFVETPIANLVFGMDDGRLLTPSSTCGGVAGTFLARLILLDRAPWRPVEATLSASDLPRIRWAVMTNAVRGSWPVAGIGNRPLASPPAAWLAPLQRWAWAASEDAILDPAGGGLRQ